VRGKLGKPDNAAGSAWPALIAIRLRVVVTVVPETVYAVAIAYIAALPVPRTWIPALYVTV
jgi:hypothetical protein